MPVLYYVIFLTLFAGNAFGYSTFTHRLINDKIYVESTTDEYYSGDLGFTLDSNGRIAKKYQTKQPWQLFEDAGEAEDATIGLPPFRYINHYDDPLMKGRPF